MKFRELYRRAVETGIANDLRGRDEIDRILKDEKAKFEKLEGEEREFFDQDRLFNPFADTRILNGDPEALVRKAIAGIDMEVGEVLLTHLLNQSSSPTIDLIISHHPEGTALARLHDVMHLQAELLANCGLAISVAEQLMEKRIAEVERRLLPANHNRAVAAARILNLPMICIHTPADNCVTKYLTELFQREKPEKLKDLIKLLRDIPEYRQAVRLQTPPKIVNGTENNSCGKIFVDMTGGTEGSKDILEKLSASGVSTLVGMHLSEEHLEKAKKANLNVIIAGHISSDNLGLNILFDEIEKIESLDVVAVSGFERIRRM